MLPWLYTQDSMNEIYEDKNTWQKSNSSLGTVKMTSYLDDLMNKSKNDLSTRVTMLCKDFNIKQLEQGSWLTFKDLNNEAIYDLNDLKESYAIGGVDLSSTTDLTVAVLLIQKDNKKYVISQFFMPSEVIERRKEEDNVPYDIWVKRGLIIVKQGNQNDFTLVTQWFLKMIR